MKLTDLKITDRGWPLVVRVSKSDVIHISRQHNEGYYSITNCGKALHHPRIVNYLGYTRRWKYCNMCGKKEDFEAALNEHKEKIAQVNEELERIREADREAALIRG